MTPKKLIAIFINKVVSFFFKIIGFFATIITIHAPLSKNRKLPPITSDLLTISAKKLTAKIRNKEVKCVEVVEAYINRINAVNNIINSVKQDRFSEALLEAGNVDKIIETHDNIDNIIKDKPLFGVPITVKESIAVKGLSNNSSRSRVRSNIAEEDAECVRLLRNAGAIPLLVSLTPELCCYLETYSVFHGWTNNPYDTRRTCSGSSGGEASLLGAGASLVGVGSDLIGSLRIPAMFCGIFSHKPTPGFVPITGHIPGCNDPKWEFYFSIGPLSRYAEDLSLMLQSMIPVGDRLERLRLKDNVDIKDIKVYYMYGEGKDSIIQDEPNFQMKKAVKVAVDCLNQHCGCSTTKVELTCFKNSLSFILLLLNMKSMENVYQKSDDPEDYDLLRILQVLLRKITFQTAASLPSILLIIVQLFARLAPNKMKERVKKRVEYTKQKVLELLGDDGVLIYPTFPVEAQFHDRMCGQILNTSYCTIFNMLGLPVTQCHVGFTREGLPVGVQIVSAPENDRLSLAVAEALSSVTGGWKPPDSNKV